MTTIDQDMYTMTVGNIFKFRMLQLMFNKNHGEVKNCIPYHSVTPLANSICERSIITCEREHNL